MKVTDKINKYYFNLLLKKKEVYQKVVNGKVYLSDKCIISIIDYNDSLIGYSYCNNKAPLKEFIDNIDLHDYIDVTNTLIGLNYVKLNSVTIDPKYFTLYKGCQFKINVTSDIKPVLVYDNENLIGFILPCKEY